MPMKKILALCAVPALLAACASAPAPGSQPDEAPVCVVSVGGGAAACPHAKQAPPEGDESCIERATDPFTHGAGARVYAFCTPGEALKKATKR